jgi:hypothetical protein
MIIIPSNLKLSWLLGCDRNRTPGPRARPGPPAVTAPGPGVPPARRHGTRDCRAVTSRAAGVTVPVAVPQAVTVTVSEGGGT